MFDDSMAAFFALQNQRRIQRKTAKFIPKNTERIFYFENAKDAQTFKRLFKKGKDIVL